jgi:hypothetical protein
MSVLIICNLHYCPLKRSTDSEQFETGNNSHIRAGYYGWRNQKWRSFWNSLFGAWTHLVRDPIAARSLVSVAIEFGTVGVTESCYCFTFRWPCLMLRTFDRYNLLRLVSRQFYPFLPSVRHQRLKVSSFPAGDIYNCRFIPHISKCILPQMPVIRSNKVWAVSCYNVNLRHRNVGETSARLANSR